MNLFDRFRLWIANFLKSNKHNTMDIDPQRMKVEVLSEYEKHLTEINRALVHLVYERKNLEREQSVAREKMVTLEEDLKTCLFENRDVLAAEVLSQIDQLKTEESFYESQLKVMKQEIEKAREAEVEMEKQLNLAKSQLNLLIGKQKVVKVRRMLMARLEKTTTMVDRQWPKLQEINDQIQHLEAESEVQDFKQPEWQSELTTLRSQRKAQEYSTRVIQLKNQLFRKSLGTNTSRVLVPEIVN